MTDPHLIKRALNRFPPERRTRENAHGSMLQLEQDSRDYYMSRGQLFIPYELDPKVNWKAQEHPFLGCEGQLVGITPWLSKSFFHGASSGVITRVRTMVTTRRSRETTHQVEILGRPTCWSAADHFERL